MEKKETRWVAIYEHTDQVGFEQSQTFHEVKVLTGDETIKQVMRWANQLGKAPNVLIVLEREPPLA